MSPLPPKRSMVSRTKCICSCKVNGPDAASRRVEVFQDLSKLMALSFPEAATAEEIKQAVEVEYKAFVEKHSKEKAFLEYLRKEWSGKIGKN
jgi:hypothetical protein